MDGQKEQSDYRRTPAAHPGAPRFYGLVGLGLITWFLVVGTVLGGEARSTRDLADLSLEQLMNEPITSVSKREQKLSQAPAAVYVITQEDIHRSGATTIAEALRLAPGLSVAQLRSHDWVITSRGFGAQFAGKLLVLIDGRAVYTPFFSGVYWDAQDVLLEDLDRIEVIRGPGAALWGANAVNGVINIITKKAGKTQGSFVTGGGGTEWYGGAVRYGGRITDQAHFRVYAKYDDYDALLQPDGTDAHDSWRKIQAGFRVDWQPWESSQLTFQGDFYNAEINTEEFETFLTPPYFRVGAGDNEVGGGNLLGRWTHSFSDESELSLQTYYDRTSRQENTVEGHKDTFDLEVQHRLTLGARNNLILGAGYRLDSLRFDDSFLLTVDDARLDANTFNAFIQDEISLVKDRVSLTLGSKFEHNEFTGLEIQPSGRLMWTPDDRQSIWGSVARAVRTPNFLETRLRVNYAAFDPDGPGPTPLTLFSILPDRDIESESLVAYELGYRLQATKNLFFDVAGFYNDYEDLVVLDSGGVFFETTPPPPHLTVASRQSNRMKGETYGVEMAPSWKVNSHWTLSASYSLLKMNLHSAAANRAGESIEGDSPQHQFQVRSHLSLPHNLSFDTTVYYVDHLPTKNISSYVRLDLRLGWRPARNLQLSVGVRDLLDDQHAEFRGDLASPTDTQRSFYGKLSWSF